MNSQRKPEITGAFGTVSFCIHKATGSETNELQIYLDFMPIY